MSNRFSATFFAVISLICFWILFIFNEMGGDNFSIQQIFDGLTFSDPSSVFMAFWALALIGGLLLRRWNKKLALALSFTAPVCGLAAVCIELSALHRGVLSMDHPEGEAVFVYLPRLASAACGLAITLFGLTVQMIFSRAEK